MHDFRYGGGWVFRLEPVEIYLEGLNILHPLSTSCPKPGSTPTNNSRSDSHQASTVHDLWGDNLADGFPTTTESSSTPEDVSVSHFT